MIQMASSIDRRPTRVLVESDSGSGAQYYRCDFLVPEGFNAKLDRESRLALYERYKSIPELPHAFTIEEQTSGPIPAHFHRVPQFQVITGGQGKLGRHAVRGFAVHYTDPYTAYGPIVPGDGSTLSYYTLRMQYDPGANYLNLPGARELLQPSRKRFLLVDPDTVNVATPEALLARTTTSLDTLIPEEDDGVAAYLLRVAPGGNGDRAGSFSLRRPVLHRCQRQPAARRRRTAAAVVSLCVGQRAAAAGHRGACRTGSAGAAVSATRHDILTKAD